MLLKKGDVYVKYIYISFAVKNILSNIYFNIHKIKLKYFLRMTKLYILIVKSHFS